MAPRLSAECLFSTIPPSLSDSIQPVVKRLFGYPEKLSNLDYTERLLLLIHLIQIGVCLASANSQQPLNIFHIIYFFVSS